jgi:hypothetical protein
MSTFLDILNGNFENIPKDKSKIVKIFLSSTFSGFDLNLIKFNFTQKKKFIFPQIKNKRYSYRT